MAVTAETLRHVRDLRRKLLRLTDEQTVALTRAWVNAWDALLPDFEAAVAELVAKAVDGKVPYSVVIKNVRLREALAEARAALDVLAPQVAETVSAGLTEAVFDAVDAHAAIIQSQLPPPGTTVGVSVSFSRVPREALQALVDRTAETIHSTAIPLAADVEQEMKRALVRGIAVGDNPRRTAARLIKATGSRFNGGLARALNISRTETLDAYRAATKLSEQANTSILKGWEWSAQLDARTCPSCWAQHGGVHPLDEDGPLDHQQGRCARVTLTKSWKELGFDIPEPPSASPDARKVFDNLHPSTQAQIMGAKRLELLQQGKISWDDLSTKRTTGGWRDSFGVTPLKDLGG